MGHKSFLNESSLNIRETEGLSGVRELNLRVGSRDRRSQRSSGTNYRLNGNSTSNLYRVCGTAKFVA